MGSAFVAAQPRQATLGLGPVHVDEAGRQVQDLLASSPGSVDDVTLRRTMGKVLAMRGEFDVARDLIHGSLADAREAVVLLQAAAAATTAAFVEIRAGDLATAEQLLRDGLAYRGEYEEAAGLCRDVRDNINEQDLVDVIALNALQGFLVARTGELSEGERLSARAAGVAAVIDFYESKGQAFEWHARTLALVGKPVEARRLPRLRSRSTGRRAMPRQAPGRGSCSSRSPPDSPSR